MADPLPHVLFCIDIPNWALDFKSTNIIKHLQGAYECRKLCVEEIEADDIEWADVIIIFFWPNRWQLKKFNDIFVRKITIGGISAHTDLEGTNEAGGTYYLGLCDAIFVHNKMLYEQYRDKFDKPFYLNPNGVDTSFYTPPEPAPSGMPLMAGWAGSLDNHGAELRGYYDIIVASVKMTEGVTLKTAAREDKWRGPGEMRDFYRTLDVYLVGSRVEGTPNPALEAAACGVPLIATKVGNMPELIVDGENGFLIERTAEAMAACLKQLRDDAGLRKKMRARIREDIKAWDWSIRAKAYERMIAECLGRKNEMKS